MFAEQQQTDEGTRAMQARVHAFNTPFVEHTLSTPLSPPFACAQAGTFPTRTACQCMEIQFNTQPLKMDIGSRVIATVVSYLKST